MENQESPKKNDTVRNIIIGIALCAVLAVIIFYVSAKPTLAPQQQDQTTTNQNMNSNNATAAGDEQEVVMDILREGTGAVARSGSTVTVHYTGTLADGTVFDSSRDRSQPFSFVIGAGSVITGWDIGVTGMKVGEIRKLMIPPQLAYGERDYGPIPGNSTLIFEVELLSVQ